MTIELAQMSPSTVNGMSRAVHPVSPCACTSAYACSYDTTAATAATLITAPAVDHLIALSVPVIVTDPRCHPERTQQSEGIGFLVQSVLGHPKRWNLPKTGGT
jgi:hypothetical protein